jgi:NAD(P)-dependent dehydrogenase (short-subunit alcohol dehydrogenase family)
VDKRLGVRVAWVTGGGGALGRAVVSRLARDGWHGVATGRREVAPLPPGWRSVAADLAVADAARRAADAALDGDGDLHLALCAAGAWEGGERVPDAPDAALERMLRANLDTAWHAAHAAAAAMLRAAASTPADQAPPPRTIVLVSAFGALARPAAGGQAAYRAAKAAVAALADALAADLAERGIAVVALAPTTIDTPANRRAMPDADHARWLSPDDLAAVVAFLATPAARALSGAVLPLDARVRRGGVS